MSIFTFDNIDANPLYKSLHLYVNDSEITILEVPDGVGEIKSYAFAVRTTKMFLHFSENDWKLQAIYKQVLRSGTSVSANVHESEFAQSSSDFAFKLHIALKEANETMNWLNLLHDTDHLSDKEFDSMAADCSELIALLVSSIKTVKKNNKTKKDMDIED